MIKSKFFELLYKHIKKLKIKKKGLTLKCKLNLSPQVPWIGHIKFFSGTVIFLVAYLVFDSVQNFFQNKDELCYIFTVIVTCINVYILFGFKENELSYVNLVGIGETEEFPNIYLGVKPIAKIFLRLQVLGTFIINALLIKSEVIQFNPVIRLGIIALIIVINILAAYFFIKESKRVTASEINFWSGPDKYGYRGVSKKIIISLILVICFLSSGCQKPPTAYYTFSRKEISGERKLQQISPKDYKIEKTSITTYFFIFFASQEIDREVIVGRKLTFAWMSSDSSFVTTTIPDWEKKIRVKLTEDTTKTPTIEFLWEQVYLRDDSQSQRFNFGDENEVLENSCSAIRIKCPEKYWPKNIRIPGIEF